ncbi:hypothetical protein [Nocardia fluminea]|uniref:hypothetical protein n=1 Tax=Nocardia fluminea TaxID=134984 RepID=UPI00365B17D0
MDALDCECQDPDCSDRATHLVLLESPEEGSQTLYLCRKHERTTKQTFAAARHRVPMPPELPAKFQCLDCGHAVERDQSNCAQCGSGNRVVYVAEQIEVREAAGHHVLDANDKIEVKVFSGDDYNRRWREWFELHRFVNKTGDIYQEVIEYPDGARLESSAKESEH